MAGQQPPRVGAGSGREAWAAYADAAGIVYPEGAKRAVIMAAVDAAAGTQTAVLGEALPPAPEAMYPPDATPLSAAGPELVVVIPSRGRPSAPEQLIQAWRDTGAFEVARMLWVLDGDDPARPDYAGPLAGGPGTDVGCLVLPADGNGMVWKSNEAARSLATDPAVFAIGWAGDDHLPRTDGWAQRYLAELHDLGTGVVYGDDQHHGQKIPTQWAMTADIVRAIGRMIPALVSHLYSDNAVGALAEAAGCLRYLPDVVIEHMHPIMGKAEWDEQYRAMNTRERARADKATFERWQARPLDHPRAGLASQAAKVRALRDAA